MHFLMPNVLQSQKEFRDWFSVPVTNMVEGKEQLINRLHGVLRAFLLRRFKKNMAKQLLPNTNTLCNADCRNVSASCTKTSCRVLPHKRASLRGTTTKLLNVLMQLRKVCNHSDLFATRPIVFLFDVTPIPFRTSSIVVRLNNYCTVSISLYEDSEDAKPLCVSSLPRCSANRTSRRSTGRRKTRFVKPKTRAKGHGKERKPKTKPRKMRKMPIPFVQKMVYPCVP